MKKIIVFLFIVCIISFCGCNYREIDRGYLVSAIGFNKTDNGYQIFVEALSSSDVSDNPTKKVILSAEGSSLTKAFENLEKQLVKPLYFEQLGTAVFEKHIEKEEISFLKKISNNYGIYLILTDDINKLFNAETPSGLLGYDVIGLVKTDSQAKNQLYRVNRNDFSLPTVNFSDGKLIFSSKGENV